MLYQSKMNTIDVLNYLTYIYIGTMLLFTYFYVIQTIFVMIYRGVLK